MGCIFSRGTRANEYVKEHAKTKVADKSSKQLAISFKKDEIVVEINEANTRLVSNDGSKSSTHVVLSDEMDKKMLVAGNESTSNGTSDIEISKERGQGKPTMIRICSVTNGVRGAQVLAGWPSWLTAVAGEAINGWIPRRADSFEKLEKIGQGTYSSVYKARDLDSNKIVALKKVRFSNMDPESVRFMAREIIILRRLHHPNVMKLEGIITSRLSGSLYLIFEYMEHDLAGLAATPGIKFTESEIKCYMQQLLHGLEHCHSRGVLHRDMKGSNLLIGYNGNLKIGDFGLATCFSHNQKQPLTSRVVTLWYRPPELLLGSTDYGVSVDLWSAGCILAELLVGKPIMAGRTEVEQLHKIFKLCGSPSEDYWKKSKLPHATIFKPRHPYKRSVAETFSEFPSTALALLEVLLAVEPERRGTAFSALQSEFFTTQPLPCDPSSLTKHPPSKEFDIRLREEDARRQRAVAKKRGNETSRKGLQESKVVPVQEPDGNAELPTFVQKRQALTKRKCVNKKYNHEEDVCSSFPIEPPKKITEHDCSHSGQAMHPVHFGSSRNMNGAPTAFSSPMNAVRLSSQQPLTQQGVSQLSWFSNSVAVRGSSNNFLCSSTGTNANRHWPGDDGLSPGNSDWSHYLPNRPKSSHKNNEHRPAKRSTMDFASKKSRINYSGPLIPPGVNLDEMLRQHEKKIQNAVRRARLDKTKKTSDNGQSESLVNLERN